MKNARDNSFVFILIHGYTGSGSDFRGLPNMLKERFHATVSCPLLPGHGTSIADLIGINLEELYAPVERDAEEAVRSGKRVILVGISMGAQEALYLASKYDVSGVIAIATTHEFRFPLNLPLVIWTLGKFKRRWKKRMNPVEYRFRNENRDVYYNEMPSDGWYISRKLHALVQARADRILQPVLFVHSSRERLADPQGVTRLAKRLGGTTTIELLENESHNMFYSSAGDLASSHISTFIANLKHLEHQGAQRPLGEKVSAIIPAYNEARRIEAVLRSLSRVRCIDEIIVISDGSTDDTVARVRMFPNVTLIVHEKNLGKGASMDEGVRHARNDVIFFCDADLTGFTEKHAEAIITPVLRRTHDMFIGMRGNFMQSAVTLWGLNSGERALRKDTWESLPRYYKYRYRIEVGLNRHVTESGKKGFGWKQFDYTQPIKESKYGFLRGTALRWWMNFDVASAYIAYPMMRLMEEVRRSRLRISSHL